MKPILLVLAAGMGSRYGGVKQIDAVGLHNETLLDFSSYDAKQSGYGKVIYIIRKDIEKDFRERLFDRIAQNMDASYVFQTPEAFLTEKEKLLAEASGRKKPWGTLHAILCAKDALNAPFTVINADDYYGRKAYETMAAWLSGLPPVSKEHAMVGYMLKNTMSKSGSVTRGVCEVRDGYLVSMEEQKNIGYENDGGIYSIIDSKKIALTGNEWVSMNFFGFTLSALPYFQNFFDKFILKNAGSEKAEALLPDTANSLVKGGEGRIRVFTSEESWFGMTYPEDKAIVKGEIAKKIQNGYYPEKLWENE
jgi:NDP-sugar pyrophosphorylase family protein